MNILIFSEVAWDDTNSFGNTTSNFFCGDVWKKENFANFYTRSQMPNNGCKVNYYNLTPFDIIRGFFRFKINGRLFTSEILLNQNLIETDFSKNERSYIDKIHKKNSQFVYIAHELIWRSKIWINKQFKSFIKDNSPDILFAFANSPYILWPLIKYLKKYTKCKIVLFVADDTYQNANNKGFYRRIYLKKGLKKCILSADKLYAASNEMAHIYSKKFNKDVSILYKGCDLSKEVNLILNKPLRIVYAGNLFWGRDNILSSLANVLEKINEKELKCSLEIYTGATITPEISDKLNVGVSSKILGRRKYEVIKKIMHEADICLHVESFDIKNIETVRYSFSTKIIDCLQSGAQVLAIGPNGISSIDYLKQVDGAIVIDSVDKIFDTINNMLMNPTVLLENKKKTREFSKKHHNITDIQKNLYDDFCGLIKRGGE